MTVTRAPNTSEAGTWDPSVTRAPIAAAPNAAEELAAGPEPRGPVAPVEPAPPAQVVAGQVPLAEVPAERVPARREPGAPGPDTWEPGPPWVPHARAQARALAIPVPREQEPASPGPGPPPAPRARGPGPSEPDHAAPEALPVYSVAAEVLVVSVTPEVLPALPWPAPADRERSGAAPGSHGDDRERGWVGSPVPVGHLATSHRPDSAGRPAVVSPAAPGKDPGSCPVPVRCPAFRAVYRPSVACRRAPATAWAQ